MHNRGKTRQDIQRLVQEIEITAGGLDKVISFLHIMLHYTQPFGLFIQTLSEFQNQAPFQFRPCTSPIGAALLCKKVTNPPQHLSKTDVFFPEIKHDLF